MRTLIIGASGLLGRNLKLESYTMSPSSSELNIINVFSVASFMKEHILTIDKIVLLAAYTDVAKANTDKENVYRLNVFAPRNLIQELSYLKRKLKLNYLPKIIYISTDYVFDGTKGNYNVNDPICPVENNYYALTKALAEETIRSVTSSTIIRTSFCQDNVWPHDKAFIDQFTSRDTVSIIAPKIASIIDSNCVGVYHTGTERKSVYELARRLNPNVKPCFRNEITSVNIPYDTSLKLTEI